MVSLAFRLVEAFNLSVTGCSDTEVARERLLERTRTRHGHAAFQSLSTVLPFQSVSADTASFATATIRFWM